jgi:hypothetical protein
MTFHGVLAMSLAVMSAGAAAAAERAVPDPASGEFAHVFVEGADVRVRLPAEARGKSAGWTAADEHGQPAGAGVLAAGAETASLGPVATGWYRVAFLDAAGAELGWTTAAVLARATVPVRSDSPVCTDSATAWFAHNDPLRQERFAILAALARMNWIRDRMTWGEAEPQPGQFAAKTSYDTSADLQVKHGLQVLQVFHGTPGWAADKALDGDNPGKRFPRDLRPLHRFCRAMAERYQDRVLAWEPWNEANIDGFGGHTTDEMCTLQKAAFLGFKAGSPGVTVCWNVYAGSPGATEKALILGNEADAYMDTFNIHSYSSVDTYAAEMTHARETAAGKPLWLSECGIHVHSPQPKPWGDLPPAEALRQAWFIPASFATSLFSGVDRHFFFILGNYMEGDVQFGVLRHDLTPRPGYCALAAVGRFLDGARCLGRLPVTGQDPRRVYAFRAFPDGLERDVLIAWSAEDRPVAGPRVAEATVYDALGRPAAPEQLATLGRAPVFAVLPPGRAEALGLEQPLAKAGPRPVAASSVVLQAEFPLSTRDLQAQAHRVIAGETVTIPLHAYNFGTTPRSGTVRLSGLPADWKVEPETWRAEIAAGERVDAQLAITVPRAGEGVFRGVLATLRGDFGEPAASILQFRLTCELGALVPVESRPIASALDPQAWADNIVGGSTLSHRPEDGGTRFDVRFGQADPWSYPLLTLAPADVPDARVQGLRFTIQVHEGKGTFRVQFVEGNGSCYIAEAGVDASLRTPQTVNVLLDRARWGNWSPRDPDDSLQTEAIRQVMVGVNSERGSTLSYTVRDLQWVRFEP